MARIPPAVAPDWALFLDVDGTLLDYVPRPEAARVPPTLRQALAVLHTALGGAVAVVSGRRIDDLDRLFAPLRLPVAGQHGAEARRNGEVQIFAAASPLLADVLAPIYEFAARRPAIRIEDKGLSAAVHYRGAEDERQALGSLLAASVAQHAAELQLLAGHLVFDLKPRVANKGSAVDWFMAEPPFTGRVPVFIGDDRTDEDGFAAVVARGGRAIRVGLEGDSLARQRVSTPADLRDWLDRSAAALVPRR